MMPLSLLVAIIFNSLGLSLNHKYALASLCYTVLFFVYSVYKLCFRNTGNMLTSCAGFGPRICFKSHLRAKQFGEKFEELYNEVFLISNDNKEND